MRSYAVYEPEGGPRDAREAADKTVFVIETFSWPAFFFGPFWFLAHRLWLPLIGFVVVAGALGALLALVPNTRSVGWIVWLLFAVLVALEAADIRRWVLERRRYRQVATVSGRHRHEAETRFFAARLAKRPVTGPAQPKPPIATQPPAPTSFQRPAGAPPAGTHGDSGILGLFPRPEPGAGR